MQRRLVRSARLPLLVVLALLAACSPVPGADVATDALSVDLRLLAFPFPRTSPLTVGFETGTPTRRVELEAGAVVEAIHLGTTYDLALGSGPGLFDGAALTPISIGTANPTTSTSSTPASSGARSTAPRT